MVSYVLVMGNPGFNFSLRTVNSTMVQDEVDLLYGWAPLEDQAYFYIIGFLGPIVFVAHTLVSRKLEDLIHKKALAEPSVRKVTRTPNLGS